jgi:hypothetical protein
LAETVRAILGRVFIASKEKIRQLYNICSELLRLSSKQPQAAPSNQTSSYGVREISMMWERMALKL